ncbi:Leucine-rich receptor-like protein kinase family protein [Abeliophyllum distichum]|uniref:Leucine-rich receptor-like protein kinase family protein n=1 Tax=Abeliophyllum distichum TaxID=126358 RepID=A0ABD1Q6D9_9LAMI
MRNLDNFSIRNYKSVSMDCSTVVENSEHMWLVQLRADTQDEIQALNAFKLSLHDPLGALTGWEPSTLSAPCDWRGVSCYNGRVSELRLPRLHLSDALSPQSRISPTYVAGNYLSGEIPGDLPKNLRFIDLSSNSFSGDIPKNVSSGSQLLQLINLSYNRISEEH